MGEGTAGSAHVAFVGKITYDGEGNFVNPFTVSFNGAIVRSELTGTYTVNSDCTGSFTATDGSSFDFVVSPDGSKLDYVRTNADTIINGTAARLARLKDRD